MRKISALISIFIGCTMMPITSVAVEIPNALKDWSSWALHGNESIACVPLMRSNESDDEATRACVWPAQLNLDVDASGARFDWQIETNTRTRLTLPGDIDHWPIDTQSNGKPIAVVEESELPTIWLDAGSYRLTGRIRWDQMPESIMVPSVVAMLSLQVNGVRVFPLQREDDSLWLGRGEQTAMETDRVNVRVFRKLVDEQPAVLHTQVMLDIAGRGREETIGLALPEGFIPTSMESDLPAVLGRDGVLKVQARPGSYELKIVARAIEPLKKLAPRKASGLWPTQEVWSFEAQPSLRVADASGAESIDPAQAEVPEDWRSLPAWLLGEATFLEIKERARGIAISDENRLRLNRNMRLSFDGSRFRSTEFVSGNLIRDWRLDMAAPFDLSSAKLDGDSLLITRGKNSALKGVELRTTEIKLNASADLIASSMHIPVTGWQQRFDQVNTNLHLGPGYRLWAAMGADKANGSWIEQWRLLDLFALAFAALLGFWLRGIKLAVLVLAALGLSYHEAQAPIFSLISVLLMILITRSLPESRFKLVASWLRNLLLGLFVLLSFPFIYTQIRAGLYPQLETKFGAGGDMGMTSNEVQPIETQFEMNVPVAQDVAPQAVVPVQVAPDEEAASASIDIENTARKRGDRNDDDSNAQTMEKVIVTGSRIRKSDAYNLNRYQANTMVQAGNAVPEWSWHQYQLSWNGPVKPDQMVRLLVTGPWFMRLFRFALVALVVVVAWRLLEEVLGTTIKQTLRNKWWASNAVKSVNLVSTGLFAVFVFCSIMPSASANAQSTPSKEILESLSERLLEAPKCMPQCGDIAQVQIEAQQNRIELNLQLHAAERIALPIPFDADRLRIEQISLDGKPGVAVLHLDGQAWVAIERGVHRLTIIAIAAEVDKLSLQFSATPRDVQFTGDGWDAQGIDHRQLLGDTVELVRVRGANSNQSVGQNNNQDFEPFVKVTRSLIFGLEWQVENLVERIAPVQSGFAITLPLLSGEQVLTSGLKVETDRITISIPAGVDQVKWDSKLDIAPSLKLSAPAWSQHNERWVLLASPIWSIQYTGVPVLYPESSDEWEHQFAPIPGENLEVKVTRPESAQGSTLAIDRANVTTSIGQRARQHQLRFDLRSTQGGRHAIQLPIEAVVTRVSVAGNELNLRPEKGLLTLPVTPGAQSVEVDWRDESSLSFASTSPELDLKADVANINFSLNLPENRWLLGLSGTRLGPALTYYGEVLVFILLAFGLSRWRYSPLRFFEWVLLGLGFSAMFWIGFGIVAACLMAFAWRDRIDIANWPRLRFNLLQLCLIALAFAAMAALFSALLWFGLFRSPDMGLVDPSYQSSASNLRWFLDQSSGKLQSVGAWSMPMWIFRALMLVWAIWLAIALSRWLRMMLVAWQQGGWWKSKPAVVPPPIVPSDTVQESPVVNKLVEEIVDASTTPK